MSNDTDGEKIVITKPGIYDIPAGIYHADPCETPSLSAGMINDMLMAPAKCFYNSRRLNPDYEEPDTEDRFTLGSVRHVMFLEPHLFEAKVAVIDFDDWRSKDAKTLKAMAIAAGQTPILKKHFDKVRLAREAFFKNQFTADAFKGGLFEQSLFWQDAGTGIWCRARPDCIHASGRHIIDYKVTTDANPWTFGRHAYNLGYHRRAAWYLDGATEAMGVTPQHYWFVNQEAKAPYLTSVVELDMLALEAGRAENRKAATLFHMCLRTGDWFGFRHPDKLDRDLAFRVGLPNYAMAQIDERTE